MKRDQAIQFCKVRPTSICIHGTGNRGNRGSVAHKNSAANLRNVRYNGFMSKATKRKCATMLEAWIYTLGYTNTGSTSTDYRSSEKLQFITLTLSADQAHTDQELRRNLLGPFIQDLKRYHGVEHYFWKAEKADNSRLHFHLLVSTRIGHQSLRDLWNKHQSYLGYIQRYRASRQQWHKNGFRLDKRRLKHWPLEAQLKAYNRGQAENWSNPNSTDIHSLRQVRSAHAYIVKYCVKSVDKNKVNGRIWGCSDSLRDLVFTSKPMGMIEQLELHTLIRKTQAQTFNGDHFSVTFNFTSTQLQLHAPSLFYRLFTDLERFKQVLSGSYQPPTKPPPKKVKPPDLQQKLEFPTAWV